MNTSKRFSQTMISLHFTSYFESVFIEPFGDDVLMWKQKELDDVLMFTYELENVFQLQSKDAFDAFHYD